MRLQKFRIVLTSMLIAAAGIAMAASGGKVNIREWTVPTANSRPHDPALAPDGALWFTEQLANKLGRLDPATGQIKEFPLKTADSGPHGLVSDHEGNIWFTANFKGYIGKLNPKTGDVAEYHMPDSRASDPHTPAFDENGILWFTVQNSNFVGRLDPRSGAVKLQQVPTSDALPYGMAVTHEGVPYFCEFGSNKLASVDPKTMAITEYHLPREARHAGWQWRRMIRFTTAIMLVATSDISIPQRRKLRNGRLRAARAHIHMELRSHRMELCGTPKVDCIRTT